MSVRDYVGLYEVSNWGRVRSLNYNHTGKVKVLKQCKNKDGYLLVDLCKDGKRKNCRVHRLVWETFVGKIPEGYELDHRDGDKTNNRLENLKCVTHEENVHNSVTFSRQLEAMKKLVQGQEWRKNVSEANRRKADDPEWRRKNAEALKKLHADPEYKKNLTEAVRKACNKPVLQIDKLTGEIIREWTCQSDVEMELGIYQGNISKCCNGKRKLAGGYIWRYAS